MTDLMDFKPKRDTIEVILKNRQTGDAITKEDGTEMSITIFGSHTRQYKDAVHEQSDIRLEKASKEKDQTLRLRSKELEQFSIHLAEKITHSWDIVVGGHVPPLEMAKQIYEDFPWVREQVLEAVDDLDAFLKP